MVHQTLMNNFYTNVLLNFVSFSGLVWFGVETESSIIIIFKSGLIHADYFIKETQDNLSVFILLVEPKT